MLRDWWITFSLVHFLAALFFLLLWVLFTGDLFQSLGSLYLGNGCISGQGTCAILGLGYWCISFRGVYAMMFIHALYIILYFSLSGTHLLIVASFLLFQVRVEKIAGPFHGLKDLLWSIQLHLTTLPSSFLKKESILIQTIGRTLFQKYISMNLQLIGLAFAMLWTWMLVLEGKQKLIWALYAI